MGQDGGTSQAGNLALAIMPLCLLPARSHLNMCIQEDLGSSECRCAHISKAFWRLEPHQFVRILIRALMALLSSPLLRSYL